jgi:Asp-tRNA(Asn)/Glu-tRNA(Gln) amidotransferase B subunit
MRAKTLEQLLNQTGLRKRLAEQSQRRAVRNAVLDAEPQKLRERQAISCLILKLFVGQIVKRLQHQHPKHND